MPRWNRGKDKANKDIANTAGPAAFAVPEWVIDSGQHYREAAELVRTGSRSQATITSVTFGGKHYDGVVWMIGMRVQPDDGDAFDAELALALDAEFEDEPPREVGEIATVVFDPAEPIRVRFLPPNLASDGS
jgi:hypothetical protein